MKSSMSNLRRILTFALVVCALCIGWGHAHAAEQGHVHDCLLCQWAGTPVCLTDAPAFPVTLAVLG